MIEKDKGQNREEKSKISELIEDIEKKTYAEGYVNGYSDGKEDYFHYICAAFNWFKETYGITHLLDMYNDNIEDSITHLLNMYQDRIV